MTVLTMNGEGLKQMLGEEHLLQTLSPALSDMDRSGLPVDAPDAQWVTHIIQIGTCKNELDDTRYIDLLLEHSDCGAVWVSAPLEKKLPRNFGYFARIDERALDGKAYGIVYASRARFSRVRVNFVGTHDNPVPLSALALIGPKAG